MTDSIAKLIYTNDSNKNGSQEYWSHLLRRGMHAQSVPVQRLLW